jgi:hypothetical protein
VAWAELTEGPTLTSPHEMPRAVRDATPARRAHDEQDRRPAAAAPVALRDKPECAVWVPADAVLPYTAHAAWTETVSFEDALNHDGARAVTDRSAGPGTRWFHLQLTSGRYACIEWRRDYPQTVVISIEVGTSRANATSGGVVFVRDIEEILRQLGGRLRRPARGLFIRWSGEG